MKAFAVTEYKAAGDLSALKEAQVNNPDSPTGHDILVRVEAVATNPIDYKRLGNLGKHTEPFEGTEPLIVGWDASGIVEEVGDEASLFQVGDEVMFAGDLFRPGAFAEYTLVDERIVGPKPSSLTWSEAASEPLTILTAMEALYDQLKVSPNKEEDNGKTILITGGAGGVSTAAVSIAKKVLGLTVIATGSREESIEYIKKLGADHVVNHHENLTMLRKYDSDDDAIRKQKFIGIRKYDSEASTNHNNATKDPEGSTKDVSSRNIQRTKRSKNIEDEGYERHDDDHNKQRGDKSVVVEPRSYRDVVVNGRGRRNSFGDVSVS